mmetsp:Transcript_143/g.301  ORF Transcript_143/g.301 Transcript_143/m.301 type:complete len:293 (+) Transcript_143:191-1069(+)
MAGSLSRTLWKCASTSASSASLRMYFMRSTPRARVSGSEVRKHDFFLRNCSKASRRTASGSVRIRARQWRPRRCAKRSSTPATRWMSLAVSPGTSSCAPPSSSAAAPLVPPLKWATENPSTATPSSSLEPSASSASHSSSPLVSAISPHCCRRRRSSSLMRSAVPAAGRLCSPPKSAACTARARSAEQRRHASFRTAAAAAKRVATSGDANVPSRRGAIVAYAAWLAEAASTRLSPACSRMTSTSSLRSRVYAVCTSSRSEEAQSSSNFIPAYRSKSDAPARVVSSTPAAAI